MNTSLPGAATALIVVASVSVLACGSSSSGGSTGSSKIWCILEDEAGDACNCSYDPPAAGSVVVTDCSSAAVQGTTCCADNGWPAHNQGAELCECSPFNGGCTTQVSSCSAGTAPAADGG